MGDDNIVGLRCHGIFYEVFICQRHKNRVTEGIICKIITIVGRVRTVWHTLFIKIIVLFDFLVGREISYCSLIIVLNHTFIWL